MIVKMFTVSIYCTWCTFYAASCIAVFIPCTLCICDRSNFSKGHIQGHDWRESNAETV